MLPQSLYCEVIIILFPLILTHSEHSEHKVAASVMNWIYDIILCQLYILVQVSSSTIPVLTTTQNKKEPF